MKRLWRPQILFWLALLPLIGWALRTASTQQIGATLSRLSLAQVLTLLTLNAGILLLLSGRWWLILRAQGYVLPYLSLASYRLAGFGVSYFTPGPQFGGEPLQVHLTSSRHGVPGPTAIAAVTLDKLLEMLANFTFLILGTSVILQGELFGESLSYRALLTTGGLLALPAGHLLALWMGQLPLTWLMERMPDQIGRIPGIGQTRSIVATAEEQIAQFCRQRPLALLQAMLFSALVWAALLAEYWLALSFLGAQFDLLQTISVLTAARLAFLSPTPGGLGTLEASQVLAMRALGVDPALGISMSLLIRARDITFGGLGLWWGGILSGRSAVQTQPAQAGD